MKDCKSFFLLLFFGGFEFNSQILPQAASNCGKCLDRKTGHVLVEDLKHYKTVGNTTPSLGF